MSNLTAAIYLYAAAVSCAIQYINNHMEKDRFCLHSITMMIRTVIDHNNHKWLRL